ncbi:MAG: peptidase T, partial [Clostridia bacterium]|nr:peptidase T [Clostridia bacterium]
MKAYERLLNYVVVHTTSDEESTTVPTTARQFDLANMLVEELRAIGVHDAAVDGMCYVYATLPATPGYENAAKLGFIAHMDTAPDFSGENVKPRIIENYDGGDVPLGTSGRTLDNATFPHLSSLKGRTLIVTDGTTLLGADDKAGVAEIVTMLEEIINEGTPHGKISVCFTPDEEVGSGADHFDVARFQADFGYTCDGGAEGELEYENFNAAAATFTINGFNVHPGEAKNKMINALLVACEINEKLPSEQTAKIIYDSLSDQVVHVDVLNQTITEQELEPDVPVRVREVAAPKGLLGKKAFKAEMAAVRQENKEMLMEIRGRL